jgi:hypothetical protein
MDTALRQITICIAFAAQQVQPVLGGRRDRRQIMVDRKIFSSQGVLVGMIIDREVFNFKGKKLYDLKGVNLYRLSGDLVGHLASAQGADNHLDKATDKLFPTS